MKTLTFALENGNLPARLGVVGYEGDAGCVTLEFTGAQPGVTYVLDLEHQQSGAKNVLALTNRNGTLSVVLDGAVCIPAGRYDVQLRTVGQTVTHSALSELTVRDAINAADSFDPVSSEMRQIEQRILSTCAANRLFSGACTGSGAIRTVTLNQNGPTAFDSLQDGDLFVVKFANYPPGNLSLRIEQETPHPVYFRWAGPGAYANVPKGAWQNGSVRSFRYDGEGHCFLLCDFSTAFVGSVDYYGAVRLSDRTDLNDNTYAATAKAVKAVRDYAADLERRISALEPQTEISLALTNRHDSSVVKRFSVMSNTTWQEFVSNDHDVSHGYEVYDDDPKRWTIGDDGYVYYTGFFGGFYSYIVSDENGFVSGSDVIRADGHYSIYSDD